MENVEEASLVSKTETSSRYAEQDFMRAESQEPGKADVMESKIIEHKLVQSNTDDIDTPVNYKQPMNKILHNYQCNNIHCKEIGTSVRDNGILKENNIDVTTNKVATSNIDKRTSARKNKRNSQTSDKKESLKKTSNGKTVKQRVTRKSTAGTARINNVHKQTDEDLLKKYMKLELYKINATEYMKSELSPFTCTRSNTSTNTVYNTNVPFYGVTNQQELNRYGLDTNRNAMQHYNHNLKYANQQAIPVASNSWITPKSGQNVLLNNITNVQHEIGQSNFVDNTQYHDYTAAAIDYNRKWNASSCSNSLISPIDPYRLYPVQNNQYNNPCYYPCNTRPMNCACNNMCNGYDSFLRTNIASQQTVNNPNYITSIATSSNLSNGTAEPFNNLIYRHKSLQTNWNFKESHYTNFDKLYYANNNGCTVMSMMKENVMPSFNDRYHMNSSLTTLIDNSLDASQDISISPDVSNTSQSYVHVNSKGEHLGNYRKELFESSLPAIELHELDPYKTNKLLEIQHENSTENSTNIHNDIISDVANFFPETNSADASEEFTSCMYSKTENLLSESGYTDTF